MATYVACVPEGDIVELLESQIADTSAMLRQLPDALGDHRYAPDKWSIREVIGHMSDTERVFAYRALRFSRGDPAPLAGFDENDYVRSAPFSRIRLVDLVDEFEHLRRASVHMFRNMDDDAFIRVGIANGIECSVRALAYVCAGHELHHLNLLRTRYL